MHEKKSTKAKPPRCPHCGRKTEARPEEGISGASEDERAAALAIGELAISSTAAAKAKKNRRFRLCEECQKIGLELSAVDHLPAHLDALVRLLVREASSPFPGNPDSRRRPDIEGALGAILLREVQRNRVFLRFLRTAAVLQMERKTRAGVPMKDAAKTALALGLVPSLGAAREAVSALRSGKVVRKIASR